MSLEACRWGDCDELTEGEFCEAHKPTPPCIPSIGEECGDCHRCGRSAYVHTYPVNDLVEHWIDGRSCPCGPTIEAVFRDDGSNGWHVIHHSLDGREGREGMNLSTSHNDGCSGGYDRDCDWWAAGDGTERCSMCHRSRVVLPPGSEGGGSDD